VEDALVAAAGHFPEVEFGVKGLNPDGLPETVEEEGRRLGIRNTRGLGALGRCPA
jgi:hypothetical protein